MYSRHHIEQVVFDLQTESRQGALYVQERVSNLFNRQVNIILNRLLTEMELKGQHIRIKKLEIDTGQITIEHLDEDLPGRIESALREALERLIHQYRQNSNTDNFEVIYTAAFYLDVFRNYLESGTLGNVFHHTEISPEAILIDLLKSDAAAVIRLIRESGKRESVRKRIAWHLEEPAVISVVRTLEPANASVILNYVNDFDQLKQQEALIRTETEEFKRAKYFFVLSYLILERGSIFNTREFVRSLLKQMAGHYNLNYRALLLTFMEHIDEFILQEQTTSLPTIIKDVFIQDFPDGNYFSGAGKNNAEGSTAKELPENNLFLKYTDIPHVKSNQATDPESEAIQTSAGFLSDQKQDEHSLELEVSDAIRKTITDTSALYRSSFLYLLKEGYLPVNLQYLSLADLEVWLTELLKRAQRNSLMAYLRYNATPQNIERLQQFFPVQSVVLMDVANPAIRQRREQITESMAQILKQLPLRMRGFWKGRPDDLVMAKAAVIFWKQRQGVFSEALFLQGLINAIAAESMVSGNELLKQIKEKIAPEHYLYTRLKTMQLSDSDQDKKRKESEVILSESEGIPDSLMKRSGESREQSGDSFLQDASEEWNTEHDRSMLIYYLRYGVLPWWAKHRDEKQLPELLRLMLHPLRLKSTLLSLQLYVDEPAVVERLLKLMAYRLSVFEGMMHVPLSQQLKAEHWEALKHRLSAEEYRDFRNFRVWSSIRGNTIANKEWLSQPFFDQLLKRPVYFRAKLISTFSMLRSEAPYVFYHPFIQQIIHVLWFVMQWERIRTDSKTHSGQPDYWLDVFLKKPDSLMDKNIFSDGFLWDRLQTPAGFIELKLLDNEAIAEAKRFSKHRSISYKEEEKRHEASQLTDLPVIKDGDQEQMPLTSHSDSSGRTIITANVSEKNDLQEVNEPEQLNRQRQQDINKESESADTGVIHEYETLPGLHSETQYMKEWEEHLDLTLQNSEADTFVLTERVNSLTATDQDKFVNELLKVTPDESGAEAIREAEAGSTLSRSVLRMEVNRDTFRDVLLEFLSTGYLPANPICSLPQLPEKIIAYFLLLEPESSEYRHILSLLKNKTIRTRFLDLYKQQAKVVSLFRALFRNVWQQTEPLYLDLWQLTLQHKIVLGSSDLLTLNQMTLLFFIQEPGAGAKAYVQYILDTVFKTTVQKRRFMIHLKQLLVSGKIVLRSNLPLLLLRIMQPLAMERKEKERKERVPLPGDQTPPALPVKDSVLVDNAGLVLLWPFFSFYFETLELTKENRFVSDEASFKAVYLLDYLVYGNEEGKELKMTLNKVLCAVPRQIPLGLREPLTEKERTLTTQLLETAISRWSIIGNTSIEGLRESFLKRTGKLEWIEEKVILTVEPKAYDMLIDKLPWSISTVRLPWLEKNLIVKWRN